jgi:hypothetical protein
MICSTALNMREDTDRQMDSRRTWRVKANYFVQLESAIRAWRRTVDGRRRLRLQVYAFRRHNVGRSRSNRQAAVSCLRCGERITCSLNPKNMDL